MEVFNLTLSQMLMMFSLILLGFILRKRNILSDDAYVTMSKLETWVFVPALNFKNMITYCTVSSFAGSAELILWGLGIMLVAVGAAYPLSAMFVRRHKENAELAYRRNIYKYAMAFGNYGFMGNFIVLGIWGEEMFFKYSMFCLFVSIFCSAWGLFILIPKEKNAGAVKNLINGFVTPPMIALIAGIVLGLLGVGAYVPDFIMNALSGASGCMGPVAMLLAGFVIGGYNFRELVTNGRVYAATVLRLVVIPAIFLGVLHLIGAGEEIMTLTLIAFATPLGLNTVVYPAAYGGETKTGAAMAMISHTLSVITIPLMYLLFIVLL